MARTIPRSKRWTDAVARAKSAADSFEDLMTELVEAIDELNDVREEYQEWYDNMPEGLQQSPTGEKLSEIINFEALSPDDIQEVINDLTSALDEYDNAELPQGFGRD